MSRRLTAKQEAFCQEIANGKLPLHAYVLAYDWNGGSAGGSKRASEESKKPLVAARIAELRGRISARLEWTRDQKLRRLQEAVDEQVAPIGKKQLTSDQLKAVELATRMQGQNEPEKLKVEGMGSLLQKIRRTAPKP